MSRRKRSSTLGAQGSTFTVSDYWATDGVVINILKRGFVKAPPLDFSSFRKPLGDNVGLTSANAEAPLLAFPGLFCGNALDFAQFGAHMGTFIEDRQEVPLRDQKGRN